MSKWAIVEDEECVHIVPETDIKPHGFIIKGNKGELADMDCPCNPRVDFSGMKPLVIHNSFEYKDLIEKSMNSTSQR